MPSSAGGNDEGSSSPSLLLDERVSLAPMMEYTDRYEISTRTQRGRGGGVEGREWSCVRKLAHESSEGCGDSL